MESTVASLDELLGNSTCESQSNGCAVEKGQATLPKDHSSSEQPHVIVPSTTCSTSRSANLRFPDNASTVNKVVIPISASNAPITVLLPKDKVSDSTCNLLLSPLLFLSNNISKKGLSHGSNTLQNVSLSKQGTLEVSAHREKVSTLTKNGVDPLGNGTSATIGGRKHNATQQGGSNVSAVGVDGEDCSVTHAGQTNCNDEDLRNRRSSSVEAEDSLGDLLSKHFDPDSTDNSLSGMANSPSSEIAKQRSLLLGRAKIRHVCDICNRECPSKHKLRRHLSTHSEERPFACQLCGKTFKWTEYLQKHMRQQHLNGVEGCSLSPSTPPVTTTTQQPSIPYSSNPIQDNATPTTNSPPTPTSPHTPSLKSPPAKSPGRKKQSKQRSKVKSVRSRKTTASKILSDATKTHSTTTTTTQHQCPVHVHNKRTSSSSNDSIIEVSSVVLSESESPPKATAAKDVDSDSNRTNSSNSTKPLPVSIPKMQNASVGVNMDEEELKVPQTSNIAVDTLDITLDNINASSGPEQTVLASNFSTAVCDVMAEPIPSNCIVSISTTNSGGSLTAGTGVQTMGESRVAKNSSLMHNQEFDGDFQHCFPLNSTSNNNSMLSQGYPQQHLQLLNNTSNSPNTLSTYSLEIMQQSNQMHVPHGLSVSTQSDSSSMDVSGSNSVQQANPCAPLPFPIQQDPHTVIDSISNALLSQNHLPLNVSPDSIQPPDLIPVVTPTHNSSFSTQQQANPNLLLDQQSMSSMGQFTYSDMIHDSDMNSQYSMLNTGTGFNGNSIPGLDGGLGMLSPNYLMEPQASSGLGMCDTYPSAPSYLDIQQARQLLYENTQQMKRILKSYQSLQNTLLRVTAGTQAAMLPPASRYNGFVDNQGLMMTQHHSDHMMQQQSNEGDHMLQIQDHMMQQQSSKGDHMLQIQDHMMQQQSSEMHNHMIHHQQTDSSHMTQVQDHVTHPQPGDSEHMQDHMTHHQPNDNQHMLNPQQNYSDHMMHHQSSDSNQFFQPHEHNQLNDTDHVTQLQQHTLQQSHDTPQLNDHMIHLPPNSQLPTTETIQSTGNVDPPSLILCEPSELLTPVTPQADDIDPPPEKRPRLDNCSSYDIGIQCELGPETIVALVDEEMDLMQQSGDTETDNIDSVPEEDSAESPSDPGQSEETKHERTVNKYPCEVEVCNKAYVHRKDLTRHMKIRHGVLPKTLKPVAVETAEKPFVCPVHACGRSYFHMRDLRRHQRACHRVNSQLETDDQSNSGTERECTGSDPIHKNQLRFPCDYPGCVRSYVHRKDLVRHKRLYHKDVSAKPTIPIPIPYSATDLKLIRQEVKLEVEQLMKKVKKGSTSSTVSTSPSTGTETPNSPTLLTPDLILSSFDTTGVLASLGLTIPPEQVDEESLAEAPVGASAAQLISLIQTLSTTTPSLSQMTDLPHFSLPIELPVIPIIAEVLNVSDTTSLPEKGTSVDSCFSGLKEVLSGPSKDVFEVLCSTASGIGSPQNGTRAKESSADTSSDVTEPQSGLSLLKENNSLKQTPLQVASSIQHSDLDSLLEFSTQELVASSLKQQRDQESLSQQSPEALSSLAAAALSVPESALSKVLMRTVSCSSDLSSPFSCTSPYSERADISEALKC